MSGNEKLMLIAKRHRRLMRAYWRYRALKWRIYKTRAAYRKRMRLLFPSPAEVRFIELMGGKALTFKYIKSTKNRFPLTFILSLGKVLDRENVQREVRAGAMYIDFGVETPYYKLGIEIDGKNFHRDIVREIKRDEYCAEYGWKLLHIQADILYRQPYVVQQNVMQWLNR